MVYVVWRDSSEVFIYDRLDAHGLDVLAASATHDRVAPVTGQRSANVHDVLRQFERACEAIAHGRRFEAGVYWLSAVRMLERLDGEARASLLYRVLCDAGALFRSLDDSW